MALLGLWSAVAGADEEAEYGRTPPRLSFYDGEVSFWRPGSEDWAPARINLPLAPGDALYTGAAANLELQIGTLAFVRAGELTQLSLSNQETDFIQLSLSTGHLAVDVRSQPNGRVIEIDTPGAAIVVDRAGYYRFRVTDERTTLTMRRGGRATVTPASGEPRVVVGGERITIDSRDRVAIDAAPDVDVWDRWNYDRTDEVADASTGRYVPAGVYGAESLERYGSWRNEPTYGWVWAPTVEPDWVPYSSGSWIWDSYYGWTWVDNAPWGWAPAHYGRWVNVNHYWAWAPGPVVVSPFYAPAVVAFFGGGVGVSVGFGVSWVALGWGEPLYPWWGSVGFIGRPCWRGWGGPRWDGHHGHGHDNHGDGHHGSGHYQNAKVHNAVLVADKGQFGHGPISGQRVPSNQAQQLAPVSGAVPVKPVPASLAPQQGPAVRPPSAAMAKPVVATRQAHDPSSALQAAGLSAPVSAPRRPARVVSAPPQSAPRSAPAGGRGDSIDRAPISAPRSVDAPQSAPAVGGRPRASGVTTDRPQADDRAPVTAPRSVPAAREVPAAPPMSAPRQQDRDPGSVHSAPPQQAPPPVRSSRSEPRSAPRNAERVQPPAPPRSAPQQGQPGHSAPAAPRQGSYSPQSRPHAAPRQAAPRGSDSAPMTAPRAAPRGEAPPPSAPQAAPPAMRGPSSGASSHSAPMNAPRGGGSSSGGASSAPRSSGGAYGGGASSAPRSGGGSYGGGPSSAPRGGGGSYGGGASSAPRGGGGSGGGGSSRQGGGGIGSGPRN